MGSTHEGLWKDYWKIYKKEGAPKYYKEEPVTVVTRDGKVIDGVKTFKVVKEREIPLQWQHKEIEFSDQNERDS